jgi:hypothetical protein
MIFRQEEERTITSDSKRFWKKREMVYEDGETRERETEGVYIPIPQSLADSALFTARHVTALERVKKVMC